MAMNETTMDAMYEAVAAKFAVVIEKAFESELTLKALWGKYLPGLPFDRTDRWNIILLRELEKCWKDKGPVVKSPMTPADKYDVLEILAGILDYNLFSQVMLNLQNWTLLRYRIESAAEDTKLLAAKWEGKVPDPVKPGAKMFTDPSNDDQVDYNRDLSIVKSLKIIAAASSYASFRVSPKGSTPALADSSNLSMLGVGSDRYLHYPPGINIFFLNWEKVPAVVRYDEKDGKFYDPALSYGFSSKSGGEALNVVLAARQLAVACFRYIAAGKQKVFLPRYNSLMIMTNEDPERIHSFAAEVRRDTALSSWPVVLYEGHR